MRSAFRVYFRMLVSAVLVASVVSVMPSGGLSVMLRFCLSRRSVVVNSCPVTKGTYDKWLLIQPKIRMIGRKVKSVALMLCIMYLRLVSMAFFWTSIALSGSVFSVLTSSWYVLSWSLRSFIKCWSVVYFVMMTDMSETRSARESTAQNGGSRRTGPNIRSSVCPKTMLVQYHFRFYMFGTFIP